jgi:uncharacterized protein YbaR (Trm112 family)
LEEIQLLFFMEKASRFQDELVLEVCADILKKKKAQLIDERDNLTKFIEELEKEIEDLPVLPAKELNEAGVPYFIIPYLYCPVCQVPLELDSASLSNGSLQKGILSCECGYQAAIIDGIILCRDMRRTLPLRPLKTSNPSWP